MPGSGASSFPVSSVVPNSGNALVLWLVCGVCLATLAWSARAAGIATASEFLTLVGLVDCRRVRRAGVSRFGRWLSPDVPGWIPDS